MLVVDDDTDMRDVLASVLQELGLNVLEAQDGLEALAVLRGDPNISLIISDLKMPRCDGLELARALKELALPSAPPFVMISGYSDPALGRAEELNIKTILRKPFRLEEIYAVVARWIRRPGLDAAGSA